VSVAAPKDSRALTPVAVGTLLTGRNFAFDLYIRLGGEPSRLFLAKHHQLQQSDVDRLLERGITTLYVSSSSCREYCDYLCEHVVKDESRQPAERLQVLRDATKAVFDESFRSGQVDSIVQIVEGYARQITDVIYGSDVLLADLVGVMTHDYSTFTHATNVATYCILMAEMLGCSRADVAAAGQGALLHDVGKRFVPAGVFQKADALTARDREQIKEHPRRGFESLCRREDLSWGQLMMVYQHHERCDGGGYPVGLVGNEIHPWARMCAVADVFDALTRERPYRGAVAEADVLEYLDREAGRGFDEEIVQCWIRAIKMKR